MIDRTTLADGTNLIPSVARPLAGRAETKATLSICRDRKRVAQQYCSLGKLRQAADMNLERLVIVCRSWAAGLKWLARLCSAGSQIDRDACGGFFCHRIGGSIGGRQHLVYPEPFQASSSVAVRPRRAQAMWTPLPCSECHADIAKTYQNTGMARSFHRPKRTDRGLGISLSPIRFVHKASGPTYTT